MGGGDLCHGNDGRISGSFYPYGCRITYLAGIPNYQDLGTIHMGYLRPGRVDGRRGRRRAGRGDRRRIGGRNRRDDGGRRRNRGRAGDRRRTGGWDRNKSIHSIHFLITGYKRQDHDNQPNTRVNYCRSGFHEILLC